MPVILTTQEVEIRRIMVQSQPGQTVRKTLYQNKTKQNKKNPSQNRARGVAQGESPEFNPSSSKKKKKKMEKRPGCQWLMPVILATQVAEIRRITVQSQ
jgi:hypothetical protein